MVRGWRLIIPAAACVLALGTGASAATGGHAPAATGSHAPALPSLKGTNLPALHIKAPARVNGAGIPIDESSNWSGYVALPKSGGSPTFNYVYAQYTVPSVNCSKTGSSDAFAYHWIGLDGWTDSTVEQDGIADFCVGGTPEYNAWYEMYPAPFSTNFAVNPGDAIYSSVTYAPATEVYTLKVIDQTTGKGLTVSEKCGTPGTCDNSSAEVITEGYTSSPWIGTADFDEEFYTNADATDAAGVTGSLTDSAWTTIESEAYGSTSHDPTTEPSQIYQGQSFSRSAFAVSWERVN
jgi:hypothetical protein